MGRSSMRRSAVSFLLVVAAYVVYSRVAVPLIEPTISLARVHGSPGRPARRDTSLTHLFPAGSWELDRPKRLQTDHGIFLFDEYTPSEDRRRLRLPKCTLIHHLNAGAAGAPGRTLILRASEGAILFFDSPLNIARLRIGRLMGGRLVGDISIESPATGPERNDLVRIATRNIEIEENRIWTADAVRFQFGENRGVGRNLSIHLRAKEEGNGAVGASRLGRLESLELLHVERVQLRMTGGLFGSAATGLPAVTAGASSDDTGVVEILCEGPFRFDFDRLVGSVEEQVRVRQRYQSGTGDELRCNLLEIHFARTDSRADRPHPDGAQPEPVRLVAAGHPVVVQAPSRELNAQAERVEFDISKRIIWLEDRKWITLGHGELAINAPSLEYRFVPGQRIGELWAAGPGRLDGRFGPDARRVEAAWGGDVRMVSSGSGRILSIKSAQRVAVESVGQVSADELHVYMSEAGGGANPGVAAVQIDRLQAIGNVRVETEQLIAKLREARIWFQVASGAAGGPAVSPADPGAAMIPGTRPPGERPSRHRLVADRLHAQVIMGDPPRVEQLEIAGAVRLRELPGGRSRPNSVDAELFKLEKGNTADPIARLVGNPARGSLRGLEFVGNDIEFQSAANRVEILGPGSMTMAPTIAEAAKAPPPVTVRWSGGMSFDGLVSRFTQNVVVSGTQESARELASFSARGDLLDVTLNRRVLLRGPRIAPDLGIREIAFQGWVMLEHRLTDSTGGRKSLNQMRIRDPRLEQDSGHIEGLGPGWVVHRGVKPTSGPLAGAAAGPTSELMYLKVDFAGRLVGNLHGREVRFEEDIRCLFGAVDHWDGELRYHGRKSLAERDVRLTSDLLELVEMNTGSPEATIELRATGNAQITGRAFTGVGHRLSYDRQKDQLILEGDGRSDAVVTYQRDPNASPAVSRFAKGLFYPSTQMCKIIGIRSGEARLDQFDPRQRPNPPAPRGRR